MSGYPEAAPDPREPVAQEPPPRPPRDPDLELIGYLEKADPRHTERR